MALDRIGTVKFDLARLILSGSGSFRASLIETAG